MVIIMKESPTTQLPRKIQQQKCSSKPSIKTAVFSVALLVTIIIVAFSGAAIASVTDNNSETVLATSVFTPTPTTSSTSQSLTSQSPTSSPSSTSTSSISKDLPVKFDLRDTNRVSPIRDQGDYGSCWAFAALASVESSMLTKDYKTYRGIDLSERHLAYFVNNRETISNLEKPLEELAGLRGDLEYLKPQDSYMDNGGYNDLAMYTLMAWIGGTDETLAPYPGHLGAYLPFTIQPLENKIATAFNRVNVQNVSIVNITDRDAIKTMLMEKGAGSISMCLTYEESDYRKLVNNTVAFNYDIDAEHSEEESYLNHAVTLIGWNDSMLSANFEKEPEGNGAWLVQNSYGIDPMSYIWISYYDPYMSDLGEPVTFFEGEPATNYDNNYQYDGSFASSDYPLVGNTATFANVFTAKSDEYLKAVAVSTNQTDVQYSIQVYLNPNDGNPESGKALLSSPTTGVIPFAGYHTIPLSLNGGTENASGLKLSKGDSFSVVVTLKVESGDVKLPFEDSCDNELLFVESHSEFGQSYVHLEDGWKDVKHLRQLAVDGDETLEFVKGFGNARIKAYTCDVVPKDKTAIPYPTPASTPAPFIGLIFGGIVAVLTVGLRR